MNPEAATTPHTPDDKHAALFANLVMQCASTALLFMGQTPHPETGETIKDLETAQLFIGQLEMLEARTRGNLTKHEESLLKQSLMTTRLTFVECIESGAKSAVGEKSTAPPTPPVESAAPAASDPASTTAAPEADERKKFVKKY